MRFSDAILRPFRTGRDAAGVVFFTPATVLVAGAAGFLYVTGVLCHRKDWLRTAHGTGGGLPGALLVMLALASFPRLAVVAGKKPEAARPADPAFLIPFFAMLHWQVFVHLTGVDFTLTTGSGARFSPAAIAVLAIAGALVAGLVALHLRLAREADCLKPYAVALILPQLAIAGISVALRKTHDLHYHHYLIGATLAPFACFRHPLSRASRGALLGLFVEGAARWGLDPVWIARHA